jgi:hypothetical protein
MENDMNIIAICKDCGNGTLNGNLNPQFHVYEGKYNDVILCNRCDSSHVDVVSVERVGDADGNDSEADLADTREREDYFTNRYGIEGE